MAKLVDVRSPSTRTVGGTRRQRTGLPTVTVLVPCYNYGRYLEICVGSVLAQQGVAVDVLIIDDASSDNTAEIADRLAASDTRVRVIHHQENRGHIDTYNEGIDAIRGEYFTLVSADDFLTPGSLARAVAALESGDDVVLAYGRVVHCFHDDPAACRHRIPSSGERFVVTAGSEWIERVCRLGRNIVVSPEVVVRSDVQRRVGGYSHALPHTADLEMWLRIATEGRIAYFPRAVQAFHRSHPRSMAKASYARRLADFDQRSLAFESFFAWWSTRPTVAEEWRQAAQRHLASAALSHACDILAFRLPERAGDYADFARRTDPNYATLPDWHRYEILQRAADRGRGWTDPNAAYVYFRCCARRAYHELRGLLARWL